MKNKKCIALLATLGLILCNNAKVEAVKFYDTVGTRYEGAVERLGELGIIDGVGSKQFNYSKTVTRAEVAKMIIELSGWEVYKGMILKRFLLNSENQVFSMTGLNGEIKILVAGESAKVNVNFIVESSNGIS